MDRRIAERSRGLSRKHKLKPRDAIHLASALIVGVDRFQSWDKDHFAGVEEGIIIEEPIWTGQIALKAINPVQNEPK